MVGKGSVNHNSRKFHAKNTDPERSHLNREYINEDIRTVYHELFDEAVERYNAKQTRQDRCIADYYEKIRSGKQEKPFHELIIQIGNKDDCGAATPDGEKVAQVLDEYMSGFQQRNPTLRVFSAHLHMDEATPHLHIDFIPYTTGSKRGLDTRVSLKQALAVLGFKGGTRGMTEWNQWVGAEKHHLAQIMQEHGIEWVQKGTHEEHLSVLDYKKQERAKEVSELTEQKELLEERNESLQNANLVLQEQMEKVSHVIDTQLAERDKALEEAEAARQQEEQMKQRVKELAPSIKDLEHFAYKYSKDAEKVLPEAGSLESAKAYREKKAKPIYEKIITVLRDLYKQFKDLVRKYNRLVTLYNSKTEDYDLLEGRCRWLEEENEQTRGKLKIAERDLTRVRRVLGNSTVDEALFTAERLERETTYQGKPLPQQRRQDKLPRKRSSPSL
ncbi:MAG: recombinase [Clostridiales bacterium]|nr:recombinase [Clostridiales bacterium]